MVVLGNPYFIVVHYNVAAVELAKSSRAFVVKVVACKVLRIAVVQCLVQQRCTCWCKPQGCVHYRARHGMAVRRDWLGSDIGQLGAQRFTYNYILAVRCCHANDPWIVWPGIVVCIQTFLAHPEIQIIRPVHARRRAAFHNYIIMQDVSQSCL